MNALIVFKNGHKLIVPMNISVEEFLSELLPKISPTATNNFCYCGIYLINLGEVSSIEPTDFTSVSEMK